MEQGALLGGGLFVGDYMGLSAAGSNFATLWAMPHKNPDGTTGLGSIFFRDPLTAESTTEFEAHGHHSEVRDVSSLHGIGLRIAGLGGATLGRADGHTLWLDDNAAGWGWFCPTPGDDAGFTTPGNQGKQGRMDP